MKKNLKEKMIDTIRKIDEPDCFMIVTNKQTAYCGSGPELMAMFCCLVDNMKGDVPKEVLEKSFEVAIADAEEQKKTFEEVRDMVKKEKDGDLEKLKKIIDMLEDIGNE